MPITVMCPFASWDKQDRIKCEWGVLSFDKPLKDDYVKCYCASLNNHYNCTLAKALYKYYYEREDNNNGRIKGASKGA